MKHKDKDDTACDDPRNRIGDIDTAEINKGTEDGGDPHDAENAGANEGDGGGKARLAEAAKGASSGGIEGVGHKGGPFIQDPCDCRIVGDLTECVSTRTHAVKGEKWIAQENANPRKKSGNETGGAAKREESTPYTAVVPLADVLTDEGACRGTDGVHRRKEKVFDTARRSIALHDGIVQTACGG